MKILNIVETAYRGTLEEQDDAALWITHALKNSGAECSVLLRGNAVSYAVKGHNPGGLTIGGVLIEHAPKLDEDLKKMKAAGISVHVVREDVADRGISLDNLVSDFELVGRDQLADLCGTADLVWHW